MSCFFIALVLVHGPCCWSCIAARAASFTASYTALRATLFTTLCTVFVSGSA